MENILVHLLEKIKTDIKNGEFKLALLTFEVRKDDFFDFNPIVSIDLHVSLLLELKKYAEATKAITYYKDKPYVSQQVEDHLRATEQIIERLIEKTLKAQEFDEDLTRKMLRSGQYNEVIRAFTKIKAANASLADFDEDIIYALQNDYDRNVIFGLLLYTHKYLENREVLFSYYGQKKMIKGTDFFIPSDHIGFKTLLDELDKFNKNTTVHGFAVQLATFKAFEIFPFNLEQEDAKSLSVYFIYQARLALQEVFNHQDFFLLNGINDQIIKNIVKKYHLDMYQG